MLAMKPCGADADCVCILCKELAAKHAQVIEHDRWRSATAERVLRAAKIGLWAGRCSDSRLCFACSKAFIMDPS